MRSMGASWDREKYAVDRAYLGAERSCVMDGGRSEGSPRYLDHSGSTASAPHAMGPDRVVRSPPQKQLTGPDRQTPPTTFRYACCAIHLFDTL